MGEQASSNKAIVEQFWEALAARDWERFKSFFTPDAHYTDIPDQPAKPVTRAEYAREIMDHAAADLAAIGVECRVSEHRETEVSAAMAGAPVLSLNLSATVHAPDEVIP